MNPELLLAIKNKTKKSKTCQIIFPKYQPHLKEQILYPSGDENRIFFRNQEHLKTTRAKTKEVAKLPLHCKLETKIYKLKNLVNNNNIFRHGKKKYVRLFHGTNSRHLGSILEKGLKLVGGGALGNGFYMTPSLLKAELYNLKQQQLKQNKTYSPVILELFLPITTTVTATDYNLQTDLYTEDDVFWQFVCKSKEFLTNIPFNIWLTEETTKK